jgi:hypothetical protein
MMEAVKILEQIITRLVTEKDDALYTKKSVCWKLAEEINEKYLEPLKAKGV